MNVPDPVIGPILVALETESDEQNIVDVELSYTAEEQEIPNDPSVPAVIEAVDCMFMVVVIPDVEGVPVIVTIPIPNDPVKGVPYIVLLPHEVVVPGYPYESVGKK